MASTPIATGFGATVGLGPETTYGTAVSRAVWLPVTRCTMARTPEIVTEESLGYHGDTAPINRSTYVGFDDAGGDLAVPMAYDNATLYLLEFLLGNVETSGSGPYVHTFTPSKTPPDGGTNPSMTLELIKGYHPSTNQAEVFEGVVLPRGEITIEPGRRAQLSLTGIIAETSGGLASAGTPTYPSGHEYIQAHHLGAVTWNARALDLERLRISVDMRRVRRRVLASQYTSEPVIDDMIAIEVEASWAAGTAGAVAAYGDFLAHANADLELTFTGTGDNECVITLTNVRWTSMTDPSDRAGKRTVTARGMAMGSASDLGISVAITNGNASSRANGPT